MHLKCLDIFFSFLLLLSLEKLILQKHYTLSILNVLIILA